MIRKRSAGTWLVLILLSIATIILIAGCASSVSLDDADEVAIYAAAIREIYVKDDTFGGTLQAPVIYIVAETDDSIGDPDIDPIAPRRLNAVTQDGIVAVLADLPTEIVWVEAFDDVELNDDTDAVPNGGAIVRVGNLHPQSDGSVLLSTSIYIANLAAGGQTYVLEQVDGVWTVTGNTGVQWIS